MQDLKISLIQFDIAWENSKKNLAQLDNLIFNSKGSDIIILPEMFTTGFTMNPEKYAEHFDPKMTTLNWMQNKAQEFEAVIMGSVSIEENGEYYNRLLVVFPDRTFIRYDKTKLFSMGEENNHYSAGKNSISFEWKGWKIKPLICYELRFPELARNSKENPFNLLIYVANWPEVRREPWRALLRARAIENQCFLAGVNRVGHDGNGIKHCGDSLIIDAKGEIMFDGKNGEEQVISATLKYSDLQDFRNKFPVLNDI